MIIIIIINDIYSRWGVSTECRGVRLATLLHLLLRLKMRGVAGLLFLLYVFVVWRSRKLWNNTCKLRSKLGNWKFIPDL